MEGLMQNHPDNTAIAVREANALLGQHITDYNNVLTRLASVKYDTPRWHRLWEQKERQEKLLSERGLASKLRGWLRTCYEGTHIPILEGRRIVLYPRPW
ncbi:MAG: hypothetical protein KBD19_01685 [Candidatus Moranbacteria bacterium]|nr:hypothetical protein [Candidatus Moranbacteria bacterium]